MWGLPLALDAGGVGDPIAELLLCGLVYGDPAGRAAVEAPSLEHAALYPIVILSQEPPV